jgi:hypothetical protein
MSQVTRDFGDELRRRRTAAGLSLRDLAALVHYSRGYLSKVETRQAAASIQLARLCDAALQAGGELIALASSRHREAPVTGGYSGVVWAMSKNREPDHHPTAAFPGELPMTGASPLEIGSPFPFPVSDGHNESASEAFRVWFGQIRALGQRVGPGVLLPMLIAQTYTLRDLAASARGQDRESLFRLAACYAEYTGWMMQEAGEDGAALWWTGQAAGFAAAGGDPVMGVYAHVRRSLICLYRMITPERSSSAARRKRRPGRRRGFEG